MAIWYKLDLMIKRILVGLGGMPGVPTAVRYAIELAKEHDAELTAVSVLDFDRIKSAGPTPVVASVAVQDLRERSVEEAKARLKKSMEAFESDANEAGLRFQAYEESGDAFSLFTSRARTHDISLFNIRGVFEYRLFENPKDAILKVFKAGVRPIIAVPDRYFPIRKVLIAYNGSVGSAAAMRRFIQMRLWPKAKLTLAYFDTEESKAKPVLEEAASYCRAHGHEPELKMEPTADSKEIISRAENRNFDLIVLGDSHRNILVRKLFGDTTLHAVRHSDRALFLAH